MCFSFDTYVHDLGSIPAVVQPETGHADFPETPLVDRWDIDFLAAVVSFDLRLQGVHRLCKIERFPSERKLITFGIDTW